MGAPSSDGPLQFGRREAGVAYRDRPAAFGVAAREDGRIATVKVTRPEGTWFDLPGGAIEAGESEEQALAREFGEETGLEVRAGVLLAHAGQFMRKSDGEPVNNLSALFEAELVGEDLGLKIERDHELHWLDPLDAMLRVRHDSHAWAVAAWLRRRAGV